MSKDITNILNYKKQKKLSTHVITPFTLDEPVRTEFVQWSVPDNPDSFAGWQDVPPQFFESDIRFEETIKQEPSLWTKLKRFLKGNK